MQAPSKGDYPTLIAFSPGSEIEVRVPVVGSSRCDDLARFGPKARGGITELRRACSDGAAKVRDAAGVALTQIEAK